MSELPLIEIALEADRRDAELQREADVRKMLIRSRIVMAQTAAEAVGIRRGSVPWKVIGLIAKIAGWEPLHTTKRDLANDECCCSMEAIKKALSRLQASGLVSRAVLTAETYLGKMEETGIQLLLNRDRIRQLSEHAPCGSVARIRQSTPSKLECEEGGTTPGTTPGKDRGTEGGTNPGTNPGTNENHTICSSLSPNSLIPPSPEENETEEAATADDPWDEIEKQIVDCGKVDRVKQAIREAQIRHVSPVELSEAVYVLKHTPELSGGALFDWMRSGAWPKPGVRSAAEIRTRRRAEADKIRGGVLADAANRSPPPPRELVLQVCAKRLRERNLEDQLTIEERESSSLNKLSSGCSPQRT